ARLHQHDDAPRAPQRRDEVRQFGGEKSAHAPAGLRPQPVDRLGPGVPATDGESLVGDVLGEVLAHHAQAHHADVELVHARHLTITVTSFLLWASCFTRAYAGADEASRAGRSASTP